MAGGRPSKFIPEILKLTKKYIDSCEDSYDRIVKSTGKKSVVYEHKYRVKLPTLEGLAYFLHINKDTIQDWKKKHAEFSVLIDDLLAKQAERLVNNGLVGDYNPTIAKVLLTKHGYREGHEVANPDGTNVFRPSDGERKAADKALDEMG